MAVQELYIPKIGILASRNGDAAEEVAQAIYRGDIQAEVGILISSKSDAGILNRAERWNRELGMDVRSEVVNNSLYPGGPRERGQSEASSERICELLEEHRVDIVLQLGYMVICNDPYITEWGFDENIHTNAFEAAAFNWHPGLLPLTADSTAKRAAEIMLNAWHLGEVEEAGHVVHAVAQQIDAGPKVVETPVPFQPGDTAEELKARVHERELEITAEAVNTLLGLQREYLAQREADERLGVIRL